MSKLEDSRVNRKHTDSTVKMVLRSKYRISSMSTSTGNVMKGLDLFVVGIWSPSDSSRFNPDNEAANGADMLASIARWRLEHRLRKYVTTELVTERDRPTCDTNS